MVAGKVYLSNAFSLQMVNDYKGCEIEIENISIEELKEILKIVKFISVIGHEDTARVLSGLLNVEVPHNRESIKLTTKDILIVAQVVGGRLPEGCTSLPCGISMKFKIVRVKIGEK